jgi:hypothetical protein
MANESEQVEGGEPVATAKTLLTTTTAATINGNGSQEPSPTLQVPSIIPSIKITKVNINYSDTRDVTLLFIPPLSSVVRATTTTAKKTKREMRVRVETEPRKTETKMNNTF